MVLILKFTQQIFTEYLGVGRGKLNIYSVFKKLILQQEKNSITVFPERNDDVGDEHNNIYGENDP